ncbi:MAG: M23 family metallopeptidase [Nitrospiraceae bacterium]|nr:MAG: M23 family metallopeptidase [Nitrospiraceae bacterium]
MRSIRNYFRRAFTPITIMLIPHSNTKSIRLKIPSIGIVVSIILWIIGSVYVFSIAINSFEYKRMSEKLNYYTTQFLELKTTISALKRAEYEFRTLFSLNDREKILESIDNTDSGSIDMEWIRNEIKTTMENIGEIKDYLSQQRDLYFSTPKGWPVAGRLTSSYGRREHPKSRRRDFHSGVDIAAGPGTPVTVTADGIVSFSGWAGGNGNLVVVEHGHGYSTFYAHNKKVNVKVGQEVRRGDIISFIGSTGNSTGPHVHYEIWKEGKSLNPYKFIKGRS